MLIGTVKPQNICVARKANDPTLYLIDFGLASPLFTVNDEHQPLEEVQPKAAANARRRVVGSVRYLSVHAHQAVERYGRARRAATSRRCDLEAVAYVAMYLHEGRLPWSDLPAKTGPEPDVAIHRAKVRVPPSSSWGRPCRRRSALFGSDALSATRGAARLCCIKKATDRRERAARRRLGLGASAVTARSGGTGKPRLGAVARRFGQKGCPVALESADGLAAGGDQEPSIDTAVGLDAGSQCWPAAVPTVI